MRGNARGKTKLACRKGPLREETSLSSGYKIVDRRTGTPLTPDVFDRYEVAVSVALMLRSQYRAVVPAGFHGIPFVFGAKVYPCPAKDEPVPVLTYHGSGPKRVMVQEHPCVFDPGKMCHHPLCAAKAHHNDYRCPCPAGHDPMPKMYYHPDGPVARVMVCPHPCEFHPFYPSEVCHHVSCAWEAHSNDDYRCQQSTPPSLEASTNLWRIESVSRKDAFARWKRKRRAVKT